MQEVFTGATRAPSCPPEGESRAAPLGRLPGPSMSRCGTVYASATARASSRAPPRMFHCASGIHIPDPEGSQGARTGPHSNSGIHFSLFRRRHGDQPAVCGKCLSFVALSPCGGTSRVRYVKISVVDKATLETHCIRTYFLPPTDEPETREDVLTARDGLKPVKRTPREAPQRTTEKK